MFFSISIYYTYRISSTPSALFKTEGKNDEKKSNTCFGKYLLLIAASILSLKIWYVYTKTRRAFSHVRAFLLKKVFRVQQEKQQYPLMKQKNALLLADYSPINSFFPILIFFTPKPFNTGFRSSSINCKLVYASYI